MKRYGENDVADIMLLNFFNPPVADKLPEWLYGSASAQKKASAKRTLLERVVTLAGHNCVV